MGAYIPGDITHMSTTLLPVNHSTPSIHTSPTTSKRKLSTRMLMLLAGVPTIALGFILTIGLLI